MKYIVTFVYSFIDKYESYKFKTYQEACSFMKSTLFEEVRLCREKYNFDSFLYILPNGISAKIETEFPNKKETTWAYISIIQN